MTPESDEGDRLQREYGSRFMVGSAKGTVSTGIPCPSEEILLIGTTIMSDSKQKPAMDILPLLIDKTWFSDPQNSRIWMRMYSVIGIPWEDLRPIATAIVNDLKLGLRVKISMGVFKDMQSAYTNMWLISQPDGTPVFDPQIHHFVLPNAFYVVATSPYVIDGKERPSHFVRSDLDQAVGVLRMYCGSNLFCHMLFEEIVNPVTGQKHGMSPVYRLPLKTQGPFWNEDIWKCIKATYLKIDDIKDDEIAGRLRLAIELFEAGARFGEENKLFFYWVAIERVLDTYRSAKIKSALALAYEKPTAFVQNDLGIEDLIILRTRLFHKGFKPLIEPDVERYIQCVFLDVLRHTLGLSCERYVERLIRDHAFETKRLKSAMDPSSVVLQLAAGGSSPPW